MYAEAGGLLLPLSPIFPPAPMSFPPAEESAAAAAAAHQRLLDELLLDDELFSADIAADVPPLGNLVHSSAVLEYDLGGEGDLFNAPEAIIEEAAVLLPVDPMTADLSLISAGEEVVSGNDVLIAETITVAGIESIQNDQLNDVIYECKKEFLANSALEEAFPELPDVELPVVHTDSYASATENLKLADVTEGPTMHKSVSTGCLRSMEWINGYTIQPNFLDFHGMELGAAFGLRRAFSEGDIQTLGNHGSVSGTAGAVRSIFDRRSAISSLRSEERKEKLSRYRRKKSKRNFGHKIKYACRKALADSQPRVRGRFARTEDSPPPPPPKML